eukprot:15143516-Alexandrium_andersonii.AAC.1
MAGAADDVVAAWAARGAGCWRAGGRPAVRTGYLRGAGRGDPRGDDAVSYTHLRAHETSAHL